MIKKASVLKRLDDVLNLTAQEHTDVSVVAVAANPFDMGVEHWLQNLAEFRRLSRIDELQAATQKKIEGNGGMLALVSETKKHHLGHHHQAVACGERGLCHAG